MSNFPYFNHWGIKIWLNKDFDFSDSSIDHLLNSIVTSAHLSVVAKFDHAFPHQGLTKVLILSQSHLVCHTWPEHHAIHIDLMTCSSGVHEQKLIDSLDLPYVESVNIHKLDY